MVLQGYIGQIFLLPTIIRNRIPDDYVCLFLLKKLWIVWILVRLILVHKYSESEGLLCDNVGSYYHTEYTLFYS